MCWVCSDFYGCDYYGDEWCVDYWYYWFGFVVVELGVDFGGCYCFGYWVGDLY